MFQVQCTITIKTNKLQCVLMIGADYWWQRVGGRFSLGPEKGDWLYRTEGGIILAHTTENSPRFSFPGNFIVTLFDVPERFYDLVTPDKPLAGEGIIRQNNIGLQWEMRFPQ